MVPTGPLDGLIDRMTSTLRRLEEQPGSQERAYFLAT